MKLIASRMSNDQKGRNYQPFEFIAKFTFSIYRKIHLFDYKIRIIDRHFVKASPRADDRIIGEALSSHAYHFRQQLSRVILRLVLAIVATYIFCLRKD